MPSPLLVHCLYCVNLQVHCVWPTQTHHHHLLNEERQSSLTHPHVAVYCACFTKTRSQTVSVWHRRWAEDCTARRCIVYVGRKASSFGLGPACGEGVYPPSQILSDISERIA